MRSPITGIGDGLFPSSHPELFQEHPLNHASPTMKLYVYPIKSLRPTSLKEGTLTNLGLEYDRHFMLLKVISSEEGITLKNMHVPHFPEMSLFQTDIEYPALNTAGKVIVTYNPPGSDSRHLEIPLTPSTKVLNSLNITMHQSPTKGYDMGPEYNDWFSECFGYPVILAYLGPHTREVLGTLAPAKSKSRKSSWSLGKWELSILSLVAVLTVFGYQLRAELIGCLLICILGIGGFNYLRPEDRITFADCAPYLVISETSVQDVSGRLGEEMDRTKFRPNIVVSGAEQAFEEDFWCALQIGQARLLLTGNCIRCQSLNVDYGTGKMGTGESGTVLKKLMKDRRVDLGARFSPVFGRYSFLDRGVGACLKIGDEVLVAERGDTRSILGMSHYFLFGLG
ncbi:unnamed protein product [Penicillium salamii]|nr:unnamed protein product [Penicillium salamii]CAG7962360.1 unnamed protein product [Penicillium salamii]CAG8275058.1 unnamed protein product [Penicillium salamii]